MTRRSSSLTFGDDGKSFLYSKAFEVALHVHNSERELKEA